MLAYQIVCFYKKNEQKQKIKDLIAHSSPEQLGLKGKFWNLTLLQQLVTNRT